MLPMRVWSAAVIGVVSLPVLLPGVGSLVVAATVAVLTIGLAPA